jgi:chaperonin cofactor prefoldin
MGFTKQKPWQSAIAIGLGWLIAIAIIIGNAQAEASALESRLSRLENTVFSLRSQISSLEREVRSLQRQQHNNQPPPATPQPSPNQRPSADISDDPMFDRLATLAIELKQRLNKLESRVERVESKLNIDGQTEE